MAKLQNTGPLICISLNHKGPYCVMLRSSKDFDLHSVVAPKIILRGESIFRSA